MALTAGQQLGRYRIVEQLGAGGMGVVYRAYDAKLERDLAIKVLAAGTLDDESARRRFRNEARILSRLNHPSIQTIHDFDTIDGCDLLISELVDGTTLDDRLRAGPLPEREVARLGVQIAQGLAAAHAEGVLHRDLKPSNLRVTLDGRLKILDFGLATLTRDRVMTLSTTAGSLADAPTGVAGTLPYMSPEQLLGETVDERSDIYSAGVVLFELATGRLPFSDALVPKLTDAILHQAPPPPRSLAPRLSSELERIILKCLEKERDDRYQSAKELAVDLRRIAGSSGLSAAARPGRPRTASRWKYILPACLLLAALATGAAWWLRTTEYFWRNPISDARFQPVTDFEGLEEAAAISRDGHFVAFLSDRDGRMDVWVTQVGSGQFNNLTHGAAPELVNPAVRTLGFSPDGSLVTFWGRKNGNVSIWAVPTLGGQIRPYLEGAAELDWSRDGSRLTYHTAGPGDPLYVTDESRRPGDRPIFTAPTGLHSHFPLWAPDMSFIYFVEGTLPDGLDIWRIPPHGGTPVRITSHSGQVSHPVFLDAHTLAYLATDPDGSGPRLYSVDVDRRAPHRLTSGLDRYTSLAASADGRRLVATLAIPKRTLWRLPLSASSHPATPSRMLLPTSAGFSPRLGPDYLVYVTTTGTSDSLRKLASGVGTELWSGPGARIFGAPAISPDGRQIAFSVRQEGRSLLYIVQSDGANVRVAADSLDLQGNPAWNPDGASIISGADDHGTPHLYRVPVGGGSPTLFVREYAIDPAWSPDGSFVVYSGPDIGTTFSIKAVTRQAVVHPLPALALTVPYKRGRGARHLAFLPGGQALVVLQGEIQHKNLWLVDLQTGEKRQLTDFTPDFDVRDFDISPDGREVVLERVEERSDIVLLDLPAR